MIRVYCYSEDPEFEPMILECNCKLHQFNYFYCIKDYGQMDHLLNQIYSHAYKCINSRWLEAEPIILEYLKQAPNPSFAVYYAFHIIRGRWSEAEPYIMRDALFAFSYIIKVIGDRWPEAEPYIIKSEWAEDYQRYVMEVNNMSKYNGK